jgi:enoyl-CoA hydratase/carnithine racemase
MSLVLTEELEPGILLVTMNRPERLNALSQGLIAELHATFERINTDRSVRVVILTGAGRGFCSGDDLKVSTARRVPRAWGRSRSSCSPRSTWRRCTNASTASGNR